jgi:hypothetical protein
MEKDTENIALQGLVVYFISLIVMIISCAVVGFIFYKFICVEGSNALDENIQNPDRTLKKRSQAGRPNQSLNIRDENHFFLC